MNPHERVRRETWRPLSGWEARWWPPKRYSPPHPWNLWMLLYMVKKDFANVIKLRTLRWEDYPVLSRWDLNAVTDIIKKGRQGIWHTHRRVGKAVWSWRRRLQWSAANQEMPPATRSWKRQGMIFPWSLRRKHSPADTWFGPVILVSDFWPSELWENMFLLF